MEEFVIDRSRWLSAEVLRATHQPSSLLNPETGLMCALGQYGKHKQLKDSVLANMSSPVYLEELYRSVYPEGLFVKSWHYDEGVLGPPSESPLLGEIIRVNDGEDRSGNPDTLTPTEREERLVDLFGQLSIQLSFVGDSSLALSPRLDRNSEKLDTTLVA